MKESPAVAAVGLWFGFSPETPVLSGLDLELQPGELLAVIGPNGAGKSTLLNLLSWTLKPWRGEVRIFGTPAGELSSRERSKKIAVVPQEPAVAFSFTVMEIVLMGRASYLGRFELAGRDDLQKARRALERTGLSGLAERKFFELSGGEKQRVMVAKALAQESRLLLLDEPTAFLDLKRQVEIYRLVRGLVKEERLAVLAVSHDMNLAGMFCDRMAVLAEGKILASGTAEEIMQTELLARVYGVELAAASHPARPKAPLIFPLP